MYVLCFHRFSERLEAILDAFLFNVVIRHVCDVIHDVASIEFQLHANSHITLWLPVLHVTVSQVFLQPLIARVFFFYFLYFFIRVKIFSK